MPEQLPGYDLWKLVGEGLQTIADHELSVVRDDGDRADEAHDEDQADEDAPAGTGIGGLGIVLAGPPEPDARAAAHATRLLRRCTADAARGGDARDAGDSHEPS